MLLDEDDYIAHYGTQRKSGRYPWGSGQEPVQSNKVLLDYVADMRREGMTETQIAEGLGISTTQLRAQQSIAKNAYKAAQITRAEILKAKGWSNVAIGKDMGLNESSVRALLADGVKSRNDALNGVVNVLRNQVAEKKFLDVGTGVEQHMGISTTRLATAVAVLQEEGYALHSVPVQQLGTGKNTTVKVLAPPGTTWGDVVKNKGDIQQVVSFSDDGGRTNYGLLPPKSISANRVGINYHEDGGSEADGVIYVRPGVKDVTLDGSRYAQVRILVGKGHYLKGMAMYKADLPEGVDLVFNTNKSDTGNKLDALKKISDDPDNPFGAVISRQIGSVNPDGSVRKLTSVMNIVNEEGAWGKWSKNLSSQMLSKQSPSLAKTQLNMTYEERLREFKEIQSLTNPTVRRKLLEAFGDSTDSAAVHLKAKALPNQATHVILPISSMPPNQIFAPKYKNGERVVLIRFPHGGTFEIPELVVNNNQPEARRLLKDARDAVGIHHSVAERLSGADFDGDTVLVIPNNLSKVKSTPALDGLKNFEPRVTYKAYPGMPQMTARQKGIEMGAVSNLITDMTIQKASTSELARAIKHSMVVIDAEKHNLNYRQSAKDNNITALKQKYQGGGNSGASTLISRAGSDVRIPERKARSAAQGGSIDPTTGKRIYVDTGKEYVNYKGKTVQKMDTVKKLAYTDDANTLLSGVNGTPIERVYADHSNKLKALANQARKEAISTPRAIKSPQAKKVYAQEVASLNSKLALALRNRPLERQAQVVAGAIVQAKKDQNPGMEQATLKKVKAQALNEARARTGAGKQKIVISPREWDAIQAGAISDSNLTTILSNADLDVVKALATPRIKPTMTSAMTTRANTMLADGYTVADVAQALGVSTTTLDTAINEP